MLIIILVFTCHVYANSSVSNLVTPVSYFVNHLTYLRDLEDNLNMYRKTSVIGTSGIGKTQLIRMYAYENKDKYPLIWFIDCNFNLNQEFLKLAKAINRSSKKQLISEDLNQAEVEVINYLATQSDWLLVFDNNKVNGNIKIKGLTELELNGHIIFASQDLEGLPYIIKVKSLTGTDAAALVESILKSNTSNEINFLVEAFKGYPVLIVQGTQILNNIKGLSNAKYKEMVQKSDNKVKLNVELCMKELTSTANDLLQKIALINNQSFSKALLSMITNNKDTLEDDIYQLSRYVLIANANSENNNSFFEMHDIVAETVQELSGADTNKKILEEMIHNLFVQAFPKGAMQRHITRTSPTVNENLQIMLRNAEKYHVNLLKILELRAELLSTSTNNAEYNNAKLMVEWFDNKDKNKEFQLSHMNNHEKYVYALYLYIIGCYNNFALSNPVKALEYFTRAWEVAATIEGYEYIKFNITYQLFRTQLDLGQIANAEQNINEASKIYEMGIKNKDLEPNEISYIYTGKSRLFLTQGRYEEALEQIDNAIKLSHQAGIEETSMFLQSDYQIKIEVLNSLGRYKEAYSLAAQAYETLKPFKNPDHEIFGNTYTKMARAKYGQKEYEPALKYANKAISILMKARDINVDKVQFTKDMQLARALIIKADCLSALDHIEEALEIYEKAEAIHNNIYVGNLKSSITLKHLLLEATKTACKKPSKIIFLYFTTFLFYV